MTPSVSVWTTSQLDYDQRILRMISTIESMGATVRVWDRKTAGYPCGQIGTQWTSGPGMYLDYNRRIAGLVKKHKTDLIYAADIDVMPGLMWGLRNRRNVPLLLDLHEWFPEVIELQNKPIKKTIWQMLERRSVVFASAHMTVNHSLKEIFEEKYGKNFTIVRNVPELKPDIQARPDKRLQNKILYYQGALNKGRGLDMAIKALHYLPGWRLWLVGEGGYEAKVKAKVKVESEVKDKAEADKERLEDRIVFFGRKHPEELRALAGQATLGLNLLNGQSPSYYYSLANRYFDYIHAGLPAIHMDYPEYRNLMKEIKTGRLIRELSPESVAKVVKQMTNDKQQYISMIEQCNSAKKTYNWQKESKVLVEVINSCKW